MAEITPSRGVISADTAVMRADRLLSVLLLLQAHGRLPVRELSSRLEVSPRTITRDLESLSMAGVPVYAERGRRGGWSLAEDYRTDLTGLTSAELRGLVVATTPSLLADLGLADAAERAFVKVVAALPEARRAEAERARGYLHVDPGGWRRTDEVAPRLGILDEALRRGRRVRMVYERGFDAGTVERVVDPLGLVAKGSVWYLVGDVDGERRTYRASRVQEAEVLDEAVRRPEGFDLATYWAGSRAEFEAKLPRFDAVLRVTPDGLARLHGGWWRYARIVDEEPPDAEGHVRCVVRGDTLQVVRDLVLGLGPEVDIVEPAELRASVVASLRASASRFLTGEPASP
jgi:predicted DNA-binding transcriptional regulator YafY